MAIGIIKWVAILGYWIWLDVRNITAARGYYDSHGKHDGLLMGQIGINGIVIVLLAIEWVWA